MTMNGTFTNSEHIMGLGTNEVMVLVLVLVTAFAFLVKTS